MNILDVCAQAGITLRRSGNRYVGLCPFHPDTVASFTVYPETNSFYCFGCGKGGSAYVLYREIFGASDTFFEDVQDDTQFSEFYEKEFFFTYSSFLEGLYFEYKDKRFYDIFIWFWNRFSSIAVVPGKFRKIHLLERLRKDMFLYVEKVTKNYKRRK